LIADWHNRRDICPDHGGPRSECSDTEKEWFPQRDICRPTAALAAARRIYDMVHQARPFHDGTFDDSDPRHWAEKPSRDFPFRYDDGVSIRLALTDENPEDQFLGGEIPESVLDRR
jgi:hypothetical protein